MNFDGGWVDSIAPFLPQNYVGDLDIGLFCHLDKFESAAEAWDNYISKLDEEIKYLQKRRELFVAKSKL